jgi:putative transposase
MSQSLSTIFLHLVFSTKNRQHLIIPSVQPQLFAYLAGTCRNLGAEAYRVGGMTDHVHIACLLPRTLSCSKLLEDVKKSSSAWINKQHPDCRNFMWQAGYGAFSLCPKELPNLLDYIDNQRNHHQRQTFQEEYRELLGEYGISYDEAYVWD